MIKAGIAILVLGWVPLVVTGLLHPDSNPIGFGLLGTLGTMVGLALIGLRAIFTGFRRWSRSP